MKALALFARVAWMFNNQEFDILDEVKIGTGTHLRLVQATNGKKRIETWSSLSKQWNTMYRYGVDDAWLSWKRVEAKKAKKKAVKKATPAKAKTTRKTRKKKNDD